MVLPSRSTPRGSARSTIRVAAAAPPGLLTPADGQEIQATQAPTLSWDSNSNERFQVRFSANSHIGDPRMIVGADFTLEDSEWPVPADVWGQIVNLSRRNPAGEVYWVVLGRDALGRTSFSRIRSFKVVDGVAVEGPSRLDRDRGRRRPPRGDRAGRPRR